MARSLGGQMRLGNARAGISMLCALGFSVAFGAPLAAEPKHGLSIFGELKYAPDFKHFDYVNPG